jgi:ABC-type lipoprotein release transport system permease subunit
MSMSLSINFSIAANNLLRHGRRTIFLGLALAAVTTLLILLQGLTAGIRENMLHTATTISTGHVNVGGFFKVTAGQSQPVVTDYHRALEVVKQTVPQMVFTVQRGRGWAKVISDTGSMQAGINGIDIKDEPAFKDVLRLESGNLDDLAQPNTMLVFEGQLKKLGVKVGDAVTISAQTTRGSANTVDCRVVAIARDVGILSGFNVFIPSDTMRTLYQLRPDTTGAIQIHVRDRDLPQVGTIAGNLRNALEKAGFRVMDADPQVFWMKFQAVNREEWTGQKLDVTTWEDELSFMTWTLKLLGGLTVVLMIILISIVTTGIMNTMWIAIRERTREIGALRAIGMKRGSVLLMFIIESLLLGLVGTGTGALLGAGIAALVDAAKIKVPAGMQFFLMSDRLHLAVHAPLLVGAIVLITAVSALAAIYPSIRAARLRPIEAMSHFG